MTERKKKRAFGKFVGGVLPYIVSFLAILALMVFGSQKDQRTVASSVIADVIQDNSFVVTADQLSESYIVAETARTLELPFANMAGENFVSVALRYETTGALGTGVIEKPNIIDTSDLSRGIIRYTVASGDTLASIARQFGVTETQIRWSNNMKNATLSTGQNLYIPSAPGILYTVKKGDTVAELASKYKSSAEQIVAYNDLETSGLKVGQTIILPGGELPEKERPEYVAPVQRPSFGYSISDTATRHNIRVIDNYFYKSGTGITSVAGQCTWYAWYWRNYQSGLGRSYRIDSTPGHAREWANTLGARGYLVNRTPAYGAIVQTRTNYTGHVGVVTKVVPNEYIIVREMNYNFQAYRIIESTVYWEDARNWIYIHGR